MSGQAVLGNIIVGIDEQPIKRHLVSVTGNKPLQGNEVCVVDSPNVATLLP